MQPTLSPHDNDPHDVLEIAPDVVLVARAEEELSRLAREAKTRSGNPSNPPRIEPTLPRTDSAAATGEVPAVDTSFRAARTDEGPSMARRLSRGFAGLLLAICIGGVAVAWRASGEVAKEAIANYAPQFAAKVMPPAEANPPAEQQPAAAPAPVQQASAEAPAAVQETSAETPPAAATPPTTALAAAAAAAIPADQSQRVQSMARDLASLGQEVAVLKASLAELKASNEQMSHDMAKLSEQNQRLKLGALQAKAAMPPSRRAAPAFRPTQAAIAPPYPPPQAAAPPPQYPPPGAAPYPPPQAAYVPPPAAVGQPPVDPDIPRPPMPVRQ
jgi:chemotaxis protein histidine kinase CheA